MTEFEHATALIYGNLGLLIRGPSGSGKSLLARDLLTHARTSSTFAALVGDDRVHLRVQGGRLIAEPHPRTAGLMEVRYHGIIETHYRKQAVIRMVVDFVPQDSLERMPEEGEFQINIMGLTLPRQILPAGQRVALDLVIRHGEKENMSA